MRAFFLAAALLQATPAAAGVLLEATFEGRPVRVELGPISGLAKVTLDGTPRLVDLDKPLPVSPGGFRLRRWSNGPLVAGYGTDYHVLMLDETVCGEVLTAPWMTPFLEPVLKALALLQAEEPALHPTPRDGCGALPLGLFATNGFPLMAGWRDSAVLLTTRLRFDHPPPPELVSARAEEEAASEAPP
jgi:hypothetical protein